MRAIARVIPRRAAFSALLLCATAAAASAQLPNASAAAFGMGGNFTAIARGYEAIAWNPANLAMPGRPLISFGALILGGTAGLEPVDVSTLNKFSGQVVDMETRLNWVEQARAAGYQRVKMDAGFTPLAFSVGPFGFQYGAAVYTNMDLSPDAWEAVLMGNAGRTGEARALDFTGTGVRVGAVSAGALSFALPIPVRLSGGIFSNEYAAVGITGKYVMGHAVTIAQDDGSVLGLDDLQIRFPVITLDSSYSGVVGTGSAADLSFAWRGGPWRVGVLAENVFNSFKWDVSKLAFLPGTGTLSEDSQEEIDFEQQPFSAAPQSLRDIVEKQAFKPAIAVGAALRLNRSLMLTADMKTHTGGDEAIIIGPKSRFGVGAEWRVLPFIPLRGGIAAVTDGWQAGAGFGLAVFGYELGVSTSVRRRGAASESGLMVGLVGIGR